MATVYLPLPVAGAIPDETAGADLVYNKGSGGFNLLGLAFDAATDESIHVPFRAIDYGSGNLTLDLEWYADTASTGTVRWAAQIGAITPNTDSQDIETDAYATTSEADDDHIGTTGQRLHRASVTLSNLDSLAADDWVMLKITRNADHANDDMAGDAILVGATLSYSDT